MAYSIAETSEKVNIQRADFYSRHDDASGWQHYDWEPTEEQCRRLISRWKALVNSQNGRDLDDYCLPSGINKIEKQLFKFLSNKQNRILVLGTGPGREVALLKERGFSQTIGITLGPRNVKFGYEVVGLEQQDLLFDDQHFLPFEDQSFDCIVGFQVMEHTSSPIMFLMECCRLLVPGGLLLLQTPAATTHTGDKDLHHILCPIPIQTRGLLLKGGFKNETFWMEGDGTRKNDYHKAFLQPLPKEWETRADIEFTVVAYK